MVPIYKDIEVPSFSLFNSIVRVLIGLPYICKVLYVVEKRRDDFQCKFTGQ